MIEMKMSPHQQAVLSQQVPNMSSFLPPSKAPEAYRPLNYTPTSFVTNFKEMSQQIDSNNNNNNNNPHESEGKFSPRPATQFSPMGDLRSHPSTHDTHPFKTFDDSKSFLNNNTPNGSMPEQDSISSSLQSFHSSGLPTSYTSSYNNNSMQTTLSSPSSITSNMSRSLSSSSYVKQESDEEDEGDLAQSKNGKGGKLPRKPRTIFTSQQLRELNRAFERTHYLSLPERAELAHALGLTQTQIKIWFQNKRSKFKKIIKANGGQMPPPSSLVSGGNPGLWPSGYGEKSFGGPPMPHLSPFSPPPSSHSSVPGDSWYYRMQSAGGYGSHETMFPYGGTSGTDVRTTRPNFSYHM